MVEAAMAHLDAKRGTVDKGAEQKYTLGAGGRGASGRGCGVAGGVIHLEN